MISGHESEVCYGQQIFAHLFLMSNTTRLSVPETAYKKVKSSLRTSGNLFGLILKQAWFEISGSFHIMGSLVLTEHHLSTTAYVSILPDPVHPFMTTV